MQTHRRHHPISCRLNRVNILTTFRHNLQLTAARPSRFSLFFASNWAKLVLCTWFFVRLGRAQVFDLLEDLKKKRRELCRLFNIGTLVRGPPSTALKILSRGVGDHLLTQHRHTSSISLLFAHHLGKARTAGKLYSHVNLPRNKQSNNLSPASSGLVISGTAVTPVDGRPAALRSRKDSSPGQGPVRFLQFPSLPPPIPSSTSHLLVPPVQATCRCRRSELHPWDPGAPSSRNRSEQQERSSPPPPPKSLCGHPNVGKPKPPQRFE